MGHIETGSVFCKRAKQVHGLCIIVAVGTCAVGIVNLEMDAENTAAGREEQEAGEKKPFQEAHHSKVSFFHL
jgi:hypothetical protein